MQIKQLEEQLGIQLFHRAGRKLELTPAGNRLYRHVSRAFQEVEKGLRDVKQSRELEFGNVVIGCSPTIATTRLSGILAAFSARHPRIEILVRELTQEEQLRSIRDANVDFCIGPAPLRPAADVQFDFIMDDAIHALVPAAMAPHSRRTLSLAEFARLPALMLAADSGLRPMMDEALHRAGLTLNLLCEARQTATLVAMVRNGMGAALLPRIALAETVCDGMVSLPITDPKIERKLGILSIQDDCPLPAATVLRKMVREMLPEAQLGV